MKRVLSILRGEAFRNAISLLPGYECRDAGTVYTVKEAFKSE
jgi:hypothetical protein